MKTSPDPDDESILLDAILADENWAALDASLRRDALASLRTSRRRRRLRVWAAGFGTGAIALAAAFWGAQRAPRPVFPGKGAASPPVPFTMIVRNFTEDELLAMFPKGSCVFAEVDGKTRFFILDEKLVAEGLQRQ